MLKLIGLLWKSVLLTKLACFNLAAKFSAVSSLNYGVVIYVTWSGILFLTSTIFLTFKCLTQVYLVKTSITHNKYLRFLFLKENDPISVKSAAEILSLNLFIIFLLLNLLNPVFLSKT